MNGKRALTRLIATQFLGALNDNVFKLLVIFFLIRAGTGSPSAIVAAVGVVFVLPFLLFSHAGGVIADRCSKSRVIAATKIGEIAIMGLGLAAFAAGSVPGLFACCFLMTAQSAFFGPSKLGILPEILPKEELPRANGMLVSSTFSAIVIGTPLAALLAEFCGGRFEMAALFCVAAAAAGTVAASLIPRTPAGTGSGEISPLFLREIARTIRGVAADSYLLLTILSSALFMMVASFMQLNLIPYGMQSLGMTQERSSYLFLVVAAGVGLSAAAAGKLSSRNIEFGLVPLGAFALTAACVLLRFASGLPWALAAVAVAGAGAGFFTVPIETFLQVRSPREHLGRIVAASSFLGYFGVLLAAGLIYLTADVLNLSAAQGFLIAGAITMVLAVGSAIVLPDFLVRFIIVLLTRAVYRITPVGLDNLPTEGGALLAPNHVTMVDALLVSAMQQRRIRFVMLREMYENSWWLRRLAQLMKTVPISEKDPPKKLVASLKKARAILDEGFLVCVFPEGQLTRNGHMTEFKAGFERIVKHTAHPIIPVYIGGAWGSIFSYASGRLMATLPKKIPYPVTVIFGKPLPPDTPAWKMRLAVSELSSRWFEMRKSRSVSLGEMFARSARRNWKREAVNDTTGKRLTFGKSLIAASLLARRLAPKLRGQQNVGIMLPATVGAFLANAAVTILGKTSVNLNFTAPPDARAHAVGESAIRTIITSRRFIERLGDPGLNAGMLFLEDLAAGVSGREKMSALLRALFAPARSFSGTADFDPNGPATIIFSSGSTGKPKGVVLSHYNIVSNMEAFAAVLRFEQTDAMCAALPFFHSFGFTCTLWFPFIAGFRACYHTNPLEGDRIAQAARENRATVLLATPTFLLAYIRRAKKEDFATVRYVITGAEKLRARIAESFESKFGVAPLEGYGVTELSPVVSVNIPDVTAGGLLQVGTRKGTIGQAIPGTAVKTVGADGSTPLPPGQEGLLLVKGPNVMSGYLNEPDKTAEVIRDGWYDTGDIAKIDAAGFITITDRASRFSKIGGEMVPHIALEEAYYAGLGTEERALVVTSVPDEKRGERIVVLYTEAAGPQEKLTAIINASDLPNLWKPGPEDHFLIPAVPVLGSGKLDLGAVRQLAASLASGPSPSSSPCC